MARPFRGDGGKGRVIKEKIFFLLILKKVPMAIRLKGVRVRP